MNDSDAVVDGNMLAGAFAAMMSADMTSAMARCASCGRVGPLAEMRVYERAAGLVGRCAGCDSVLMTMVPAGDRSLVSFRGMSFLDVGMQI